MKRPVFYKCFRKGYRNQLIYLCESAEIDQLIPVSFFKRGSRLSKGFISLWQGWGAGKFFSGSGSGS